MSSFLVHFIILQISINRYWIIDIANKASEDIDKVEPAPVHYMRPVLHPRAVQATSYYLVRKYTLKRSREALVLKAESVFKIAVTYSRIREFLTSKSWEFQGNDEEMEMDSFRNKQTGKKVFVADISEDFPVTFLMGELSVQEFGIIASELTPEIQLLEVDSSWEGKPTTIVVAMTEEQVRNMFGRRTKMRKLAVHRAGV